MAGIVPDQEGPGYKPGRKPGENSSAVEIGSGE